MIGLLNFQIIIKAFQYIIYYINNTQRNETSIKGRKKIVVGLTIFRNNYPRNLNDIIN